MNPDFDFIVGGGGMIGCCAALMLANSGYQVALVEAVPPQSEISPAFDQRAIAISHASQMILQHAGIWPALEVLAEPITHIHVSDQGHFGFTRLSAAASNVEALGQVVALEEAAVPLSQLVQAHVNIKCYCPARICAIEQQDSQANGLIRVTLAAPVDAETEERAESEQQTQSVSAKLLLAADGTFSQLARLGGIEYQRKPYGQNAIIANLQFSDPAAGRAFERFTQNGPLAMLPLSRNRVSLVWCNTEANCENLLKLSDAEFSARLQQAFGYRLGRITSVGKRQFYPLSLHQPTTRVKQRVVLLGNAAHTLHPIAGQGFNLGLRGLATFIDYLANCQQQQLAFDQDTVLEDYARRQAEDWQLTSKATDSLVRLFSNDSIPFILLRNKAMSVLDKVPWFKTALSRTAMGYRSTNSSLVSGSARLK